MTHFCVMFERARARFAADMSFSARFSLYPRSQRQNSSKLSLYKIIIVQSIFDGKFTFELAVQLNPDVDIDELKNEASEIGISS